MDNLCPVCGCDEPRPVEDALRAEVERLRELWHNVTMRCQEREQEIARLRAALDRFAKIDLTGPIGDEIAWDILNARAVLEVKP